MNNSEARKRAFPTDNYNYYNQNHEDCGMTLRDYFAAKAMQMQKKGDFDAKIAKAAYELADAMMEAREK